jgi:hypothetical protein
MSLTLQEYSDAKLLPINFLVGLGIRQEPGFNGWRIAIPYLGEDGVPIAKRFRHALNGDRCFSWPTGTTLLLYGQHQLPTARKANCVVLVEGESDAQTLWLHNIPALCVPGAGNWNEVRDAHHFDCIATIYVVDERDQGAEILLATLQKSKIRGRVRIVAMPTSEKDPSKRLKDVSDLFLDNPATFRERWEAACRDAKLFEEPEGKPQTYVPAYTKSLKVLDAEELLVAEFPPRSLILTPWLPDKGLAMLYAPRGVGKTWLALSLAHTIASGGEILGWSAPRPRRVLYVDGEMPAAALQERYTEVVAASMRDAPRENFRLVAADIQPDGLPDLADGEAQRFYEPAIADAELIIVDNLSTIARGLRENEADSFGPVQGWLLAQRAAGRSVVLVHHTGKNGGQRGTSRKEDVLDTEVSLRRPPGYSAVEGARFEVRFTKSRGFWGLDAEPFEARFSDRKWTRAAIVAEDSDEALAALRTEGLSIRQIAERSGLSKSSVERRLNGSGR